MILLGASACSHRPPRIEAPKVDPQQAAQQAIATYDTDRDGAISKKEAVTVPGVLAVFNAYDLDNSGAISQVEFANRLEEIYRLRTAITPLRVTVSMDGQPLEGALVEFAPEAYLGAEVMPATGTTDAGGTATMSISTEHLPESQRRIRGIHFGTYRVRVTHPTKSIPEKYHTKSIVGYETMIGDPMFALELVR